MVEEGVSPKTVWTRNAWSVQGMGQSCLCTIALPCHTKKECAQFQRKIAMSAKSSNRGNPTPATTQISAALTIWAWILAHGRPPLASECRKANGLNGYDLYYKVFGTHNFSAGVIPAVSALCGSSVKMRTCLGHTSRGMDCPHTFPDQGAHIRLCETCRRQERIVTEHHMPATVERLSSRHLGVGLGGWHALESWAQDIDWAERNEG